MKVHGRNDSCSVHFQLLPISQQFVFFVFCFFFYITLSKIFINNFIFIILLLAIELMNAVMKT